MIGGIEYRLWLDGKPVDEPFYTMVEMVTVEQGIDLATEARIEVEMCADDGGTWSGPTDDYATPWKRLRLEVRNKGAAWIPLIDGPVVSWDATMHGQPGQSMFTLIARDDTELLNRTARIATYERMTDQELVKQLFKDHGFSEAELHIDEIPAQPKDRPLKHIQRGTDIEMLRQITEPYDLHVYVVPGKSVGRSEAYVQRIRTTGHASVPPLVLVGADRNMDTFQARNDVANATRYQFLDLDIDAVTTGTQTLTSKWNDSDGDPVAKDRNEPGDSDRDRKKQPSVHRIGPVVALLGDTSPRKRVSSTVDDLEQLGTTLLPPDVAAFRDVRVVGPRYQQRSSYTITATGTVRQGCYEGVMRAFDLVTVRGTNAKLCTTYVVREVTHTFDRSEYRQDFTLMTNSVGVVEQSTAVPAEVH